MATQDRSAYSVEDRELLAFFDAIVARDHAESTRRLDASPGLVGRAIRVGASRHDSEPCFLTAISHYVYAGDTALHLAAAAYDRELAETLLARGADLRARNRRGAQPLHYAADGGPNSPHWNPAAQAEVIALLIGAGADPDARDSSGVVPLHRAVRNRCSAAAEALIEGGADPLLPNQSGSTPMDLAVRNTGKSGSGTDAAHDEQRRLIALLRRHGSQRHGSR